MPHLNWKELGCQFSVVGFRIKSLSVTSYQSLINKKLSNKYLITENRKQITELSFQLGCGIITLQKTQPGHEAHYLGVTKGENSMNAKMKIRALISGLFIMISLVLAACSTADPAVVGTAVSQTESASEAARNTAGLDGTSAPDPTAIKLPTDAPDPTAQPTADTTDTSALCNGGETLTGLRGTTYALTCVDQLTYDWPYTPGTTKTTPDLRHDAQSTGDGVTVTYDVGVNAGEFGIVSAWQAKIGGKVFGGKPNGCALFAFAPGYYYGVTITSGRWEVYQLPNSDPRDPDGWSRVLADQAQQKEHNLYECPNKGLNEIPLLISSLQTGFAP